MIHKCKDNDTILHFITKDEKIEEILVKSIGDKSWTVIGYDDLLESISEVEQKCNRKKIEPIHNLHKSWRECWDYISGAKKFQNLAIECIREQEKRFQRGTEPDKLVLQSLELAREILLNLKYK